MPNPKEKQIQNAVLEEFGTRPDMRLWRANVGVARIGRRVVRFGVPGQADLTGILADGRRLEIETKSPTGRQSKEQQQYQSIIDRFNGVYILARSISDVYAGLQRAGFAVDGKRSVRIRTRMELHPPKRKTAHTARLAKTFA